MKKIFAIICALTLVVSCKIDGSDGSMNATPDGIVAFAIDDSWAVDYPFEYFRQLFCVHLYRTYVGADRDLQWFAEWGKCYESSKEIKTEYGNRRIITNGLAFTQEGAVYSMENFDFTCFYEDGEPAWKVTVRNTPSEYEADIVFTIRELEATSMLLGISGMALQRDYDRDAKEYSRADYVCYDLDIVRPWSFANKDYQHRSCLFPKGDKPVGIVRFSIHYGDLGETDWAEGTFAGGSVEPKWTTSRGKKK